MSYHRVAQSEDSDVQQHAIQIEHGVDMDNTPPHSHRTITPRSKTTSASTSTSTSTSASTSTSTSASINTPPGGPPPTTLTILRSGLINSKNSIAVSLTWTLQQLKINVMTPEERQKAVKVIYMGRVLKDDNMTLSQCGIQSDTCIQFHLSERVEPIPEPTQSSSSSEQDHMNDEDLLYQQYWQQQQPYIHATPVFAYDQPPMELEGNNADMFVGFILGFLLQFLALIWVWQRTVTRRQKVGIMMGIGASLLTSMLKVMFVKEVQQGGVNNPAAGTGSGGGIGMQ